MLQNQTYMAKLSAKMTATDISLIKAFSNKDGSVDGEGSSSQTAGVENVNIKQQSSIFLNY